MLSPVQFQTLSCAGHGFTADSTMAANKIEKMISIFKVSLL
jgi:hypothetical protein